MQCYCSSGPVLAWSTVLLFWQVLQSVKRYELGIEGDTCGDATIQARPLRLHVLPEPDYCGLICTKSAVLSTPVRPDDMGC